jgi:sterol desaturase/sphingolipid hydroxylase (fatty acid hydroxylase superfamily)
MNLVTLLLIVLVVLVIAGLPSWPYARAWDYGYAPSGVLGLVLAVILILMLLGRL